VIYRWHYDVELRLTQSGSYAYGTIKLTLVQVDLKVSGYPPWPFELPQVNSYEVDGDVLGPSLTMMIYTGDYPTFTLVASDGQMTGSGTYYSAGALITGVFDLKKSGGFGFTSLSGMTPIVSAGVIGVAIVTLVVVAAPLKIPSSSGIVSRSSGPGYAPTPQGILEVPASPPSAGQGTPIGGVGLHYPAPPSTEKPLPPREHFSRVSQEPPRCPVHGDVALVSHFSTADGSDGGSWFCPRCNGYPWGRA
jgi:hypothetical protein